MKVKPYWIEGSWQGKLAITPRPRGGGWLEDEVRSWRQSGIDIVISLLSPKEVIELDIVQEEQHARSSGIKFLSFPIVDRDIPSSRRATLDFVGELEKYLSDGKTIAIHCRQGIGRSALIAACLLVLTGVDADAAFQRISAARGLSVPDTVEQQEWVRKFAHELVKI